jgi:hypothetical protein
MYAALFARKAEEVHRGWNLNDDMDEEAQIIQHHHQTLVARPRRAIFSKECENLSQGQSASIKDLETTGVMKNWPAQRILSRES